MRDQKTHAAYMRVWRAKHPENAQYYKEYMRKYFADPINKEKAKQRAKKWYEDNKEKAKKRIMEHYHATKILKGYAKGERNGFWKGDDVGYHGLHKWIASERGKPTLCEHCGLCDPDHPKRFQWANKSHEYRRELNDWIRLCSRCHFKYDEQHRRPRGNHGQFIYQVIRLL